MSLGRRRPSHACQHATASPTNGTAVTSPVIIRSRVSWTAGSVSSRRGAGCSTVAKAGLDGLDVDRLGAAIALLGVELDLGALGERAAALDSREVDEEVLAGLVGRDEPEALGRVEPLHCSCWHCY